MRTVKVGLLMESLLKLERYIRSCQADFYGFIKESDLATILNLTDVTAGLAETSGLMVTANLAKKSASNICDSKLSVEAVLPFVENLVNTLESECSTITFLRVDAEHTQYFEKPTKDWPEVITRFPNTQTDIEEMSKCFALDRYAASVFHSLAVVDHGLIELGEFLGVNNPKSGFTAVSNELKRIVSIEYSKLSDFQKKHIELFQQLQVTVEGLKTAWRNKISHVQGRLVIMTSDFMPDVAEEIYFATRSFMRRLATDLPKKEVNP